MGYDEQLSAAKFRAERDLARQECERLRARLRDSVPREAYERKRAAWLRQIRECEAALRKRREHIKRLENAALERRTVREEDREAAEWVREHGGLDAVKKLLDWVVGHCSTRQQLDFDFWLSGRVMYELGFDEDMADRDEVERRLLARLMPDGMEWPRYESGEPVRPSDKLLDKDGDWFKAVSFVFTCDWWSVRGYKTEGFGDLNDETRRKLEGMAYGTCVKRLEPKVLDADGVEIYKGRIAYGTRGRKYRVTELCEYEPSIVHAQAIDDGELGDEFIAANTGLNSYQLDASKLTHERPDSWERIEEDAVKDCWGYWGCEMDLCTKGCPNKVDRKPPYKRLGVDDCCDAQALDLVRRAKKLAGVSE